MLRKSILLMGFAVMATGCSTISEESCIAGSWESLGYEDGHNGESRAHFNKIAKSCAKYGISANAAEYRAGYDTGLRQYCSYDKGYDHGVSGNSRKTECLEINFTPYLDGYNKGVPLYCSYDKGYDHGERGKSVKSQCREIDSVSYLDGYDEGYIVYEIKKEYEGFIDDYNEVHAAIGDVSGRLSDDTLGSKDRKRLKKKLRRLDNELDDLRFEIRSLERNQDWPKCTLASPNYGGHN